MISLIGPAKIEHYRVSCLYLVVRQDGMGGGAARTAGNEAGAYCVKAFLQTQFHQLF